jgi:hypothetical protein
VAGPNARTTQSVLEQITTRNATARVTQSVIEVIVALGIGCNNPPAGGVGALYSHQLLISAGVPPYNVTVTAGALPPGLGISASGLISGIPNGGGVYAFTVTVTDSGGMTASVSCSITVTGTVSSVVGGVAEAAQKSRGGCSGHNQYDECLIRTARQWRHIRFPDMCGIPKEYRNLLPWDESFGAVPKGAVPFFKTGGIVTPSPASGDNVVVSWRVPVGYDGLWTGFYFGYSGSNFQQGSGDIVTRLKINQRYLKDLSNSPYLFGSPTLPLPLTEGQILLSGMLVQSVVNVPNLSGNINVNASTIYAGQIGFLWPRG